MQTGTRNLWRGARHLDFSTGRTRSGIVHTDTPPTRAEIGAVLRRHTEDNGKGKAVMLFTTTAPDVGRRAFPLWRIFHITPSGAVVPWNRRARTIAPKTPAAGRPPTSSHAGGTGDGRGRRRPRRGVDCAGATSGLLRTVGIAALVLAGLAVLGLVGTVLDTMGLLNPTRRR